MTMHFFLSLCLVFLASLSLTTGKLGGNQLSHPAFSAPTEITLKVIYWKVFEQYGSYVKQSIPNILLEGEIYPPSDSARMLSNIMFYARLILVGVILGGPDLLGTLGINTTPQWLQWMFDNKMTAVLLLLVVGSQIENQLLSTGAFEVYVNGDLVWSKLESGRLPSVQEFRDLIAQPDQTTTATLNSDSITAQFAS